MAFADDITRLRALQEASQTSVRGAVLPRARGFLGRLGRGGPSVEPNPFPGIAPTSDASPVGELGRTPGAFDQTAFGRILRVLGTGEELSSRLLLGNLLRTVDSSTYERLLQQGGPLYASDYLRALLPDAPGAVTGVGGLLLGTAIDPTTYLGLGTLTRAGRAVKAIQAGRVLPFEQLPDFVRAAAHEAGVGLPRHTKTFWVSRPGLEVAFERSPGTFHENFVIGAKVKDGKLVDPTDVPIRKITNPLAKMSMDPKVRAKRLAGVEEVLSKQGKGPTTPPKKGEWFQVVKVEDEEIKKFLRAAKPVPGALRVVDPSDPGYQAFLRTHAEALRQLSQEEKVRKGLVALVQLQVPFMDKASVNLSEGLSAGLRKMGASPRVADQIELEARGLRFAQLMDATRDGLRHTRIGQKIGAMFNIKSLMDPRVVAIQNRIINLMHEDLGKLAEDTGQQVTRRIENIVEELTPAFRSTHPELSRKEIRERLGRLVNELVEENVVVPKELWNKSPSYKAFQERLEEFLPEGYTTPFLGGAPHPLDDRFASELRELVRHTNEINHRSLEILRRAGVQASELLGDKNYILHGITDEARKSIQAQRGFIRKSKGGSLRDFLKKDFSLVRRSFRNVNLEPWLALVSRTDLKNQDVDLVLKGLGGIATDRASVDQAARVIRLLEADAAFSPEQRELASSILRGLREGGKGMEKLRDQGLDSLFRLYDKGTISKTEVNSLIHPWTTKEVNVHVNQHGLPSLGIAPGQIRQFLKVEPDLQLIQRGQAAIRVASERQFMQAIIEHPTLTHDAVVQGTPPVGWQRLHEVFGQVFPGKEHVYVDPSVSELMNAFGRAAVDPTSAVAQVINLHDRTQNFWKSWTLAVFPSYHSRNLVGNFWNNFLAGMGIGEANYYRRAAEYIKGFQQAKLDALGGDVPVGRLSGGAKEAVSLPGGRKMTMAEVWDEGTKHGLWDTGMATGDFEDMLLRQTRRHSRDHKKWFLGTFPTARGAEAMHKFGQNSWWLDFGFNLSSTLENNAKLAHFMWRLEKGDAVSEAALSVKKFLFDYTDLSTFEQTVMKWFFPFYTWTRKNIPLQLEMMVRQPGRYTRIPRTIRAVQDTFSVYDTPSDELVMSDWMRRAAPVRLSQNTTTGQFNYFLLGSWLPAAEINNIFEWDYMIKSMSAPIPKAILEQLINREIRTGRKIDELQEKALSFQGTIKSLVGKGEQAELFGVPFSRRVVYGSKSLVRLIRDADNLFANPSDMSIAERAMGVFVGRVYASDARQGFLETMQQRRQIQLAYSFAERSAFHRGLDVRRIREKRVRRLEEFDERRRGR